MNDSTHESDSGHDVDARPPDRRLDPLDQKFEAALASLRPTSAPIDIAVASFEAGRRAAATAARRQITRWRIAAGVCIAGGVAAFVARGNPTVVDRVQLVERERIVERVIEMPVGPLPAEPAGPTSVAVMPTDSLLSLRNVALQDGVDALPRNPGGRTPTLNLRALP